VEVPRGVPRREVLVIMRLQELLRRVKGLLAEWESHGTREAVTGARRCPCGCGFRHLHGHYVRFVVVGGRDFEISVPRLFCPACGKTVSVLPWFLAPRSLHPWCLRQAALVSFVAEEGGYRGAAARFSLAWQLVWAWVKALAEKAKAMLRALLGLALRYPGLVGGSLPLPSARDLEAARALPSALQTAGFPPLPWCPWDASRDLTRPGEGSARKSCRPSR
jgi:hypothetical protein